MTTTFLTTVQNASRKPVPHHIDHLLHWLRPIRSPVKYCPQAHHSAVLASNSHLRLGYRLHLYGPHSKLRRILRRPLLLGRGGVRVLPWSHVLSEHVVQAERTALSHLSVFHRCGSFRRIWRVIRKLRLRFVFDRTLTKFQAFALAKMRGIGGLGGWRWIFIIVNSSPILDVEANASF